MLHEVILSAINLISTGGREQERREASEMISSQTDIAKGYNSVI